MLHYTLINVRCNVQYLGRVCPMWWFWQTWFIIEKLSSHCVCESTGIPHRDMRVNPREIRVYVRATYIYIYLTVHTRYGFTVHGTLHT